MSHQKKHTDSLPLGKMSLSKLSPGSHKVYDSDSDSDSDEEFGEDVLTSLKTKFTGLNNLEIYANKGKVIQDDDTIWLNHKKKGYQCPSCECYHFDSYSYIQLNKESQKVKLSLV
jgi:hypothetical protein